MLIPGEQKQTVKTWLGFEGGLCNFVICIMHSHVLTACDINRWSLLCPRLCKQEKRHYVDNNADNKIFNQSGQGSFSTLVNIC